MNIQYYSTSNPNIDELVLVQFTEKCDAFFNLKLLEYPYEGIMNFQDATKRKKIYTWNKYVQLNKDMVAKIDYIDYNKKIVQVSLAYLEDMFDKKLNMMQIQNNLLMYFNENKNLE
jgi:translation initiation factor 2 alpha subunit (eIF-2alpha)